MSSQPMTRLELSQRRRDGRYCALQTVLKTALRGHLCVYLSICSVSLLFTLKYQELGLGSFDFFGLTSQSGYIMSLSKEKFSTTKCAVRWEVC